MNAPQKRLSISKTSKNIATKFRAIINKKRSLSAAFFIDKSELLLRHNLLVAHQQGFGNIYRHHFRHALLLHGYAD
jgi:hypothetical protein